MKIILCILSLTFLSNIVAFRNSCTRSDEECMHVEQCPEDIQAMVANFKNLSKDVKSEIFLLRCGEPKLRKLCCKKIPPPPPRAECYTWDGRPGTCVKVNPNTIGATSHMTPRQLRYSRCMQKKGPYLCQSDLPVTQSEACEVSAFPPDPSHQCCGTDRVTPDRITGGDAVAIDQFPWLTVIKYENDIVNCSGVLISHRYVLTAAHCVDVTAPKPYAVILGEFDKSTKYDCDMYDDCHNPEDELTIGIEEIITHENFMKADRYGKKDIALIRLMKPATYSDFILPICLPTDLTDITMNPPEDFKLWSSGWGDLNASYHSPSDRKMKVQLPFVAHTDCMTKTGRLWRSQLCAGGEAGKDSCTGDSGSGLMYDRKGVFEVLGITSHGIAQCGAPGTPAVYTKVFSYMDWIYSHIRP